jgi:hypothetical protein
MPGFLNCIGCSRKNKKSNMNLMFERNTELYKLNQRRIGQFKKFIESSDYDEEKGMLSTFPLIEEMSNLWFFTLDSQAGNKDTFEQDGNKYTTEERSYVTGFMPSIIYEKFEEKFASCPNQILYKMDVTRDEPDVELTRVETINEKGEISNDIQSFEPGKITQDVIDNYLEMFNNIDQEAYGGGIGGLKLNINEWVGVTIADLRWNHHSTEKDSVFRCIINALANVIRNPKKGGKFKKSRKRRS